MLFKSRFLDLIATKEVTLAFRKWARPTVKAGGSLLTPVGKLKILTLDVVEYNEISDSDIKKAGYLTRAEMDREFAVKKSGTIYKITFELGEDPRIGLRESGDISDDEFSVIMKKLNRMDTSGKINNWTQRTLLAIKASSGKVAKELAEELGYEKEWLKVSIRKLKNLGLTISLPVGYQISPRGQSLLERIQENEA